MEPNSKSNTQLALATSVPLNSSELLCTETQQQLPVHTCLQVFVTQPAPPSAAPFTLHVVCVRKTQHNMLLDGKNTWQHA